MDDLRQETDNTYHARVRTLKQFIELAEEMQEAMNNLQDFWLDANLPENRIAQKYPFQNIGSFEEVVTDFNAWVDDLKDIDLKRADEEEQEVKPQVKQKIKQIYEDLLVTALEGGSNYWYMLDASGHNLKQYTGSGAEKVWKAIQDGHTFTIYDAEDTTEILGNLDMACLHTGTQLFQKDYPERMQGVLDEQYDAEDADVWFQLCIMNEVKFG